MKKLVLVIDTSGDFIMPYGKLPVKDADQIILPGIKYLVDLTPEDTEAVVFTHDTHDLKTFIGSPENLGDPAHGVPGFDIHCELGTWGWENVFNPRLVNKDIPTYRLNKGVFDMWEEPKLWMKCLSHPIYGNEPGTVDRDGFFAELLARGIDTVEIWGVASDFCDRWAINGLIVRGFKIKVVEHLTAGIIKTMAEVLAEPGYEGVELI